MSKKRSFIAGLFLLSLFVGFGCGSATTDDDPQSNNDANQNEVGAHPNVDCQPADGTTLCVVTGELTEDLTLAKTEGVTWLLSGPVFVGDDASETLLTIEPGVTVYADAASEETTFLVVRRHSKLIAEGTEEAPIVFTTSAEVGQRERGMWGGIILNGLAPLNTGDEAQGEGNTGFYGGDQPDDSSGILKYVRVQFAGDLITSENELNGVAFQGVGSGTTVDFLQVHMSSDDGVEFFGGTVNTKHLVLSGMGDDSLDWTNGWQGKAQFVVIKQFDDNGDRGIEADNLEQDLDAQPRSHPTLSNLTIIGGAVGDAGILLRAGTAANIYNAIVTGFSAACLDIDNLPTYANGWDASSESYSGALTIEHSIVHGCAAPFASEDEEIPAADLPFTVEQWFSEMPENRQVDPQLTDIQNHDFRPAADSPAASGAKIPEDSFFEQVDFIGAVGPNDDWAAGWTFWEKD
jgi:hypothetical protein